VVINTSTALSNPDGIRMLNRNRLLVTENAGRLDLVDVRTGMVTVINATLDQPTSVVRTGASLWVTEGQVLRLQQGQAPHIPFKVVRVPVPQSVPVELPGCFDGDGTEDGDAGPGGVGLGPGPQIDLERRVAVAA
jgi:hypothetical protein